MVVLSTSPQGPLPWRLLPAGKPRDSAANAGPSAPRPSLRATRGRVAAVLEATPAQAHVRGTGVAYSPIPVGTGAPSSLKT